MKYRLVVLIILVSILHINAEIRFVSKSGSSMAPYTSWQTAADRIQKAIDISKRGDTIYVGNGTYVDTVRMTPGIALIGSGMDSCIINSQPFSRPSDFYTVTVNDSCVLTGFHIVVANDNTGNGIGMMKKGNDSFIVYNKVSNTDCGVNIYDSSPTLRHNIFIPNQNGDGVRIIGSSSYYLPQIDSNYITVNDGWGIFIVFGTRPSFIGNTINVFGTYGHAFSGGATDTTKFMNNLIIANNCQNAINNPTTLALFYNNIIVGKTQYSGFDAVSKNVIVNNYITGGIRAGIYLTEGNPVIKYNNSWGNKINYQRFTPDSTNMSADPMFVNDSIDFHLQMFSPMIHAGDPNIKNVDGSRSDIGIFGGPYGESYTYKDLAPRTPRNVKGAVKENNITIKWEKNTEADFAYYRIYRDTIASFIPDSSKRIAKINDTSYSEILKPGKNYYYKISAVDKQGHESPKSEEVSIITGVNDKMAILEEDYKLFPNYPNPFNPSTKIGYWLKKPGNVRMTVYDIKGEVVRELLNSWREAGYYEEEFTGEVSSSKDAAARLASGIYLLKIEIKKNNNIPVFTNMRKMMMLK